MPWMSIAAVLLAVLISSLHAQNEAEDLYEKKEFGEAGEIFAKRFQEGDSEAARFLGRMFAYGEGVKKDCKKAGWFFYFCAKKKNAACFKEIGDLYAKGVCVKKDSKKAQYFYNRSKQILDKEWRND